MFIETFTLRAAGTGGIFGFLTPLYWLFGYGMKGLLMLFNDQYFIALTVFTILTRLVLFPLNIRQQRTMAKNARIQPKIQKIQKKYNVRNISDPKQRQKANQQQQEEINALYAREGHNPMQMGCGPMAFQMIFLMGIIGIIYSPLQYILGIDIGDKAEKIATAIGYKGNYFQLELLQNIDKYKDVLTTKFGDLFTPSAIESIQNYKEHMTIGSLDMTITPSWKGGIIIIVPILCLITSLASSIVSTLIQKKTNQAAAQQQSSMMIMMLMMPLFSFFIAFRVPAAVGFYWMISNLVALVQQLVMAKFFPPKKNIAREMVVNTIERRSREESIKKIS